MVHSRQEILDAVRRHAERALSLDGEQLTILDVWIPYESDLRMGECTVEVKWTRSDVHVATDAAIYTVQEGKSAELDVFGPEWPEEPPPWRLSEVVVGSMTGQQDLYKRTPLHYAAVENDESLVRQLMAQGADVNAKDRDGFTPLHFAAQQYAVAAAKLLLEAGATVDISDKHGNTPLWTATFNSRGRGDMIQLLRVAGADPLHQNNYGRSPLTLARMIGNDRVEHYFTDLREIGTDPTP